MINKNKIKIYYQFATAKRKTQNGEKEVLKRKKFLEKNITSNSEITLAIPSHGPGSIETEYDEAIAIPNVLNSIIKAEKKDYDVAIISCFSDPGIVACREKVKIPVVGSGENSLFLASQLGNNFSILSPLKDNANNFNKKISILGLDKKYCSTRAIEMSVLDLAKDKKETLKKILKVAREAVNDDGADVLILGCMSMAFHDITSIIEEKIKVPVINPVKASLLMAESLVKMKLSHSKKTYPTPPNKIFY
tara:strand:- start:424 stop:1170 length:747 start_codon:yes stop_codon:yes gene_type:complete